MQTYLKTRLAAAVIGLGGLGACASAQLEDFEDAPRQFKLEEYFAGQTNAYGVFEDRFGKIRRQFKVVVDGSLEGNTLTLVESFEYDDGERDTRTWVIEVLGDGKYRGTANDVPGIAVGEISGNAFNWKYKVDLKVGDGVWKVGFDDWMFLMQDDVLLNRAYVTRYGVRIGEVTISFKKP
jgi:hypothetical protein